MAANFDKIITSMGQELFNWNMQFNSEDKEIRGNTKIVAKGTASLMQREVVTQETLKLVTSLAAILQPPHSLKLMRSLKRSSGIWIWMVRNMLMILQKLNSLHKQCLRWLICKRAVGDKIKGSHSGQGQGGNGPNPADTSGGGNSQIGIGTPTYRT